MRNAKKHIKQNLMNNFILSFYLIVLNTFRLLNKKIAQMKPCSISCLHEYKILINRVSVESIHLNQSVPTLIEKPKPSFEMYSSTLVRKSAATPVGSY